MNAVKVTALIIALLCIGYKYLQVNLSIDTISYRYIEKYFKKGNPWFLAIKAPSVISSPGISVGLKSTLFAFMTLAAIATVGLGWF
ncbi:MAG: hypothetical protein KME38_19310 [Spirirestis rafaelensis WJT71-NPBG6]|jgi:hypothetical protein|nr:hypothetical protein [Spirirestis rafaelensis WJT71-NPBG6]